MRRSARRRMRLVVSATMGLVAAVGIAAPAGADPVVVDPSTNGMPGADLWREVLGWVMQWGLWLSLAAIVLGAGGWWISASTGGYSGAARGKQFVLGGAIGALVIGLAPTIVNLLFAVGRGG
jgi:hypothetical protein